MRNLVLCGFMGSGKSTVGAVLARKLGRVFVDMDSEIERRAGRTVSQIFAGQGEEKFRALETECALRLSRREGLVISTGGGALLSPRNAEALRRSGLVVLLEVPLPVVRRRLQGDRTRPLLQSGREDEMRRLYNARLEAYRAVADYTVRNEDNRPAEQMADEIAALTRALL